MTGALSDGGDGVITDADVYAAAWAAVDPVVRHARRHGPIPPLRSPEFLTAPALIPRAGLLSCGQAYLLGAQDLDDWIAHDYTGGRWHRPGILPAVAELDRRRYPPTGDRDLWIRYGPSGPPAHRSAAA